MRSPNAAPREQPSQPPALQRIHGELERERRCDRQRREQQWRDNQAVMVALRAAWGLPPIPPPQHVPYGLAGRRAAERKAVGAALGGF
ncbi:MAG: hypothetical protein HY907_23015 [Deltaproteobacteria bacterium]|nr:hypothetical protein [Deltaproteobacteria bacterium]